MVVRELHGIHPFDTRMLIGIICLGIHIVEVIVRTFLLFLRDITDSRLFIPLSFLISLPPFHVFFLNLRCSNCVDYHTKTLLLLYFDQLSWFDATFYYKEGYTYSCIYIYTCIYTYICNHSAQNDGSSLSGGRQLPSKIDEVHYPWEVGLVSSTRHDFHYVELSWIPIIKMLVYTKIQVQPWNPAFCSSYYSSIYFSSS